MLEIGVVQQLFFALGGKAGIGELLGHPHQRVHQGRGAAAVSSVFLAGTQQKVGAQAFDLLFGAGAQLTGRKGAGVAVLAALDAPGPPPGGVELAQRGHGSIPIAFLKYLAQPGHAVGILLQNGGVSKVGGLVFGGGAGRSLQQGAGALSALQRDSQQILPPGGVLGRGVLLPHGGKLLQHLGRVGQSTAEMVQLQHGVAGGIVGAAPAVEVRKGAEICIGVGRFQNGGKCLLLNAGQLSFLGGGKVRRHIQRGKVLLHKMQAEGIHRADGCPLQ